MTGNTPDISNLVEYRWYQWVKFREVNNKFPNFDEVLGHYCGRSPDVGSTTFYNVLNNNGNALQHTIIRLLTQSELNSEVEIKVQKEFDQKIEQKLGPGAKPSDYLEDSDATPEYENYADDTSAEPGMQEANDFETDAFDKYLGAETLLSKRDNMFRGIVKARKRDADGNPIGKLNSSPLLATRVYKIEYTDGDIRECSANVMAKSRLSILKLTMTAGTIWCLTQSLAITRTRTQSQGTMLS
jgi:hypothetical protein